MKANNTETPHNRTIAITEIDELVNGSPALEELEIKINYTDTHEHGNALKGVTLDNVIIPKIVAALNDNEDDHMFIFTGLGADVSKEKDGDWENTCAKHFGWFDGNYDNLSSLNEQLKDYAFPAIQEWKEDPDDPGSYSYTRMENADGLADEGGEYEVYYTARLRHTTKPKPYSIGRPFVMESIPMGCSQNVAERRFEAMADRMGYKFEKTDNGDGTVTYLLEPGDKS